MVACYKVGGMDCSSTCLGSYGTLEAVGSSREEPPHVQGAVAMWGQEGLEELFHVQSQEGQR